MDLAQHIVSCFLRKLQDVGGKEILLFSVILYFMLSKQNFFGWIPLELVHAKMRKVNSLLQGACNLFHSALGFYCYHYITIIVNANADKSFVKWLNSD